MIHSVCLPSRLVLCVEGPDADTFLNGLLTQSTLGMAHGDKRYGALLTPQGRVIADIHIHRSKLGFDLDCAQLVAPEVERRLRLFKLRSRVTIFTDPSKIVLGLTDEEAKESSTGPERSIGRAGDPVEPAFLPSFESARIRAGWSEQGVDFGVEDVYPSDINMDFLDGVDFKKGCFVGQEVVSRMKRRTNVRRRTAVLRLSTDLKELPSSWAKRRSAQSPRQRTASPLRDFEQTGSQSKTDCLAARRPGGIWLLSSDPTSFSWSLRTAKSFNPSKSQRICSANCFRAPIISDSRHIRSIFQSPSCSVKGETHIRKHAMSFNKSDRRSAVRSSAVLWGCLTVAMGGAGCVAIDPERELTTEQVCLQHHENDPAEQERCRMGSSTRGGPPPDSRPQDLPIRSGNPSD